MAAQQNLTRTLKLIRLLKQRPGKTLSQLAQLLECSPRHARRFMEALEEAGFIIDSEGKRPPRFYLYEDERRQQADFTEEEAQLLQEALSTISGINPLLAPLRQKIYQHSTLLPLANGLIDQHQSQVVARLAEAIRDRRQVRLLRYHSINSNSISDRLVEPYSFSENYTVLTAYEPESETTKTFKTQRMEDVALLDSPQENSPSEVLTDPFGWPGEQKKVWLRLTYQAYHLLREEYPVTRPELTHMADETPFSYTYTGDVRSWIGLGRFVLGLPGEIKVHGPEEFREYLRGRVGEFVM